MRTTHLASLILLTAGLACRSPKTEPEPGAILLHVRCAAGAPLPDELRVWVYDGTGALWDGARIPPDGPLSAGKGADLGTILIQPGAIQGGLRVHIRGLASGQRILDGVLTLPSLATGNRTFDVLLVPEVPADTDGDDVPDLIDDCVGTRDPAQTGCTSQPPPDAGPDGEGVVDAVNDLGDPPGVADALSDPDGDILADVEPGAMDGAFRDVLVATRDDVLADAIVQVDFAALAPEAPDADTRATDLRPPSDGKVDDVGAADSATGGDRGSDGLDGAVIDSANGAACADDGSCGKGQGALCARNSDCASGYCADGVCCTNACTGPCRSCNQPTSTGVCQGYASGTDPELECSSGTLCNGVGACGPQSNPNLPNGQLCSNASQCSSGNCKDGVCCDTACTSPCEACGTGTCLPVKRTDDVPECTGTSTCNGKGMCTAR